MPFCYRNDLNSPYRQSWKTFYKIYFPQFLWRKYKQRLWMDSLTIKTFLCRTWSLGKNPHPLLRRFLRWYHYRVSKANTWIGTHPHGQHCYIWFRDLSQCHSERSSSPCLTDFQTQTDCPVCTLFHYWVLSVSPRSWNILHYPVLRCLCVCTTGNFLLLVVKIWLGEN